jgi:uncharacterized membrane protein
MIKIETDVLIDCPISDVFDYVSDAENNPLWNSAVEEVERISDCGAELDCKYRMKRVIGKERVENIYRVIEYQKNNLLTIKTLSGPTPFTYRYSFETVGKSTRIQLSGKVKETGLPFEASSFFASHMIEQGINRNLRTLKSILESS